MSSNSTRIKLNTSYGTTNDDSLKYISQLNISDLHITRNNDSRSVDKSLMMMSYLPDIYFHYLTSSITSSTIIQNTLRRLHALLRLRRLFAVLAGGAAYFAVLPL